MSYYLMSDKDGKNQWCDNMCHYKSKCTVNALLQVLLALHVLILTVNTCT